MKGRKETTEERKNINYNIKTWMKGEIEDRKETLHCKTCSFLASVRGACLWPCCLLLPARHIKQGAL
jgi:hypothetical protein